MRDHCNCGRPFSLSEWVRLPTAYYQTYSDSEGTFVQQAVHCERCKTTLIAAEVEVVCGVYGPIEKVHEAFRSACGAFKNGSGRKWCPDPTTMNLGFT